MGIGMSDFSGASFPLQPTGGRDFPLRNGRMRLPQGHLFWREGGRGPTVVLLHGNWLNSSQWVPLMEALVPYCHCLAPDLLGCGESPLVAKTPATIPLEVEALATFLGTLRSPPALIVATGIGAWVATHYAFQHPAQVRGLVLLAPEGVVPSGQKNPWRGQAWLAQPWSLRWALLRLIRPAISLLGGQQWLDRISHQRRTFLRHPVPCRLLFQRRRAEWQNELLTAVLPQLRPPTWLLQPVALPPPAQALNQAYALGTGRSQQCKVPTPAPDLWTEPAAVAAVVQGILKDLP